LFGYAAFGLSLRSDFRLPGLSSASTEAFAPPDPDVRIRVGARTSAPPAPRSTVEVAPDLVVFDHADIGRVTIREGREIFVAPHAQADDDSIGLFVAGPALAVALHQRGDLVLHASSVAIRGRAVVLLGEKGAGKSTLAATLLARGHALVSDDVVAVRPGAGGPVAVAGTRTLKVEPAVARALGVDPDRLPLIHRDGTKREWPPSVPPAAPATPLARLLVLARGAAAAVAPLPASAAFIEAVRHTYGARFDLVDRAGLSARHFGQVAELVRSVPAALATRSDDLAGLHAFAALVEALVA
jgi:hypothetical protein